MVDSGSDVTTLREEILDTLDLELLGPIQSRGVHASCTKNLYKARLQIGTEDLEIEVGSQVYAPHSPLSLYVYESCFF